MNAFIYLGGNVYEGGYIDRPTENDLVIAADGGYKNALRLGAKPTLAVGDFDSFTDDLPPSVEKMQVPAEKDFTDSQLAVDVAQKKGAKQIFLIGGLDGRIDHALSNLALLESLWHDGVRAVIADGRNRVRYIESTSELVLNVGYKYLSILAVDKKVKGVYIDGCKYPLKNARLERDYQFAVSNEIEKNCALVAVRRGGIFIVESRDAK
ncbi:MAG: thiamine diphosphokinase [Ruminococcaceae bacterium]|nr:thiamine diphosphokinase [Oscillospiraceae bacterium]